MQRAENEEKDTEEYFSNLSVFAANKIREIISKHEEQIEIMQNAIDKAMKKIHIMKQEIEFTNVKHDQMAALVVKKDSQIGELEEEINDLEERLDAERKVYKDTLWKYLEDIAKKTVESRGSTEILPKIMDKMRDSVAGNVMTLFHKFVKII